MTRASILACIFTWLFAVVGVTIALWVREWVIAAWAVNAAICAAGWWRATVEWEAWKRTAQHAIAELERRTP